VDGFCICVRNYLLKSQKLSETKIAEIAETLEDGGVVPGIDPGNGEEKILQRMQRRRLVWQTGSNF
jgi:hypothetical protein